ncbi:helix-turn-helix domain-containing protein [Rathayibacter sp. CAU 1779]
MPRVASDAAAHIGGLMAAHRKRQGMTQDQVAVLSGIDSSNVRAYETGRSMPSIQSLIRVAKALGVQPGVLLEDLEPDMFAARAEGGGRTKAS